MNPKSDSDKTPRSASGSPKAKQFFPPGSTGLNSMRLRAELQHEEAKLRIFKIFIALFVLCVGAFLVYSGISYYGETKAKAKELDRVKQLIESRENELRINAERSPYLHARALVELIDLRKEKLMPLLSGEALHAAEQANRRDEERIEKLAKVSLPAEPGQPGKDFIVPSAHLDMAGIPAGKFRMGGSMDNEMPVREVEIAYPFWIARTEVTNRQM